MSMSLYKWQMLARLAYSLEEIPILTDRNELEASKLVVYALVPCANSY